ncbi:hypothetical protein ACSMXM_05475 [Pacificimonas sp. ICDLI1SI03]
MSVENGERAALYIRDTYAGMAGWQMLDNAPYASLRPEIRPMPGQVVTKGESGPAYIIEAVERPGGGFYRLRLLEI